jgi:signal peptidase I
MTEPKRSKVRRFARELGILIGLAFILLSVRSSLADHYRVPTGSMLPTVQLDDRILVNKAAYGLRVPFTNTYAAEFDGPQIGDVVVLGSPEDGKILLKRVVAIPGTRVEVRDGRLYLGGELADVEERGERLIENLAGTLHDIRLTNRGGPDFGPATIPDGKYLVMGDNRGESHDGRSFGLVARDAIVGRAVAVYWRGGPAWEPL